MAHILNGKAEEAVTTVHNASKGDEKAAPKVQPLHRGRADRREMSTLSTARKEEGATGEEKATNSVQPVHRGRAARPEASTAVMELVPADKARIKVQNEAARKLQARLARTGPDGLRHEAATASLHGL